MKKKNSSRDTIPLKETKHAKKRHSYFLSEAVLLLLQDFLFTATLIFSKFWPNCFLRKQRHVPTVCEHYYQIKRLKMNKKYSERYCPLRKEGGWKWYQAIGLALSYSRREIYQNLFRPHPLRGIKLDSEGCFYYLNTIIVFNERHSVGGWWINPRNSHATCCVRTL